MNFIGKLLPIDGYKVLLNNSLSTHYSRSLTHLYQPLIGIEAVALYQTLLHEIDLQREDTIQTHHTLMNYLNLALNDIYELRLKLEAIGLLNTYEDKEDDKTVYVYELMSPFSPRQFFQDAMLTELLYHHLGEAKFQSLKVHYCKKNQEIKGKNITASFHDVFQTFEPSYVPSEDGQSESYEQVLPLEQIDFSMLEETLKKQMIPINYVLTRENKQMISQVMHLYDLELYEVEKSLLWALTDENKLDVTQFKEACHDLFKVKHNNIPIQLSQKKSNTETKIRKPLTKEERLIQRLDTISPKQLLEDLSRGGHASEQDMKLVRDVMLKQGLSTPVMNVLIHYVLLQTNMQLSKGYLEKIASHWSRANLTTATEAMQFAKDQLQQFKERKQPRRTASNEVIPDWFKERQTSKNKANIPQEQTKQEDLAEKDKVLALLQKHASKKD